MKKDYARICIVEDNIAISQAYTTFIYQYSRHVVVRCYTDCGTAVRRIEKDNPDIIFMDLQLPGMHGIEGIRRIRKILPKAHIVVITVHEDSDFVFDALCAGACGYLTKTPNYHRLTDAIQEVLSGGAPMSTKIARMIVRSFEYTPHEKLSHREEEVLTLIAKGKTYKAIADELFIHVETVKTHIQSIYTKLQVNNKAEAIQKAYQKRIII